MEALFSVRSGTGALQSALEYTRALGQVEYSYRRRRHRAILTGLGGGITGAGVARDAVALFALGVDINLFAAVGTNRCWHFYKIKKKVKILVIEII